MTGFWNNFKTWAARPFSADMTAAEWGLFIGMLIVLVLIWNIVLFHLVRAIRAA